MSATVSYDVFDTVVTRQFAHPRDLFVHLGARLRDAGLHPLAPLAFAELRWATELAARRAAPSREVMLAEIYGQLAPALGWTEAARDAALAIEIALEARHLRGIPRLRRRLRADRAAAGRIAFLSDMYLPADLLRPWLEREGAAEPGDLLFISGEHRANKSSGRLFAAAQAATGGDYAAWRHAGDHPFADVAKPRELGIAAEHLTHAHLTARERAVRGTTGEFAPVWRSLLAGAMRLARLDHEPADAREAVLWETGTTVAGPLFHGFVRWVLAEARQRGLRRLYFLARDGQILWRIARELEAREAQPLECVYLQASRLVFAGPAELDAPGALRWLAATTGHFHSLRQSLAHLGLTVEWAQARLPDALRGSDPDANLPDDARDALARWLLDPAQRAELAAAVQARADTARRYLHAAGLRDGASGGLVDAGWLGTIQRNLERILGQPGKPEPLTGFYLGLMPPAPPAATGTMLGFANTFDPLPLQREESHKVLIELMAQSDQGQVIGLREEPSGWTPVLNDPGPVNLAEIRLFQEAILAFTRRSLDAAGEAPEPADDYARAVLANYRRFHDAPTEAEARVFGFLPHADQLLEQHHATLCREFSAGELAAALADFRRRPPHWWIGGQAALAHGPVLRAFRALKRAKWRLTGQAD